MYVLWKTKKKKKHASCYDWIRFLSCWHTCTHTITRRIHKSIYTHVRKKFEFGTRIFYFPLLFSSSSFSFFFFFLYLKANSKRFTKRHIRRHTQTYTRIHAEKPSSIFTGLHRIRRLCIDSPRETRGSVKLFSIDQSERAYRNHHTGSDVTRFRDDFFPPSPTGVYVVFSFPVLLFLPLPSPCFRSYTRL